MQLALYKQSEKPLIDQEACGYECMLDQEDIKFQENETTLQQTPEIIFFQTTSTIAMENNQANQEKVKRHIQNAIPPSMKGAELIITNN